MQWGATKWVTAFEWVCKVPQSFGVYCHMSHMALVCVCVCVGDTIQPRSRGQREPWQSGRQLEQQSHGAELGSRQHEQPEHGRQQWQQRAQLHTSKTSSLFWVMVRWLLPRYICLRGAFTHFLSAFLNLEMENYELPAVKSKVIFIIYSVLTCDMWMIQTAHLRQHRGWLLHP